MLILPGANALSAFRTQRLLSQLQEVEPSIVGVTGRFLHFIDAASAPTQDDIGRLDALLTYGEPFSATADGDEFVVIPRFGTISPWASKATDIVHNCGMTHIKRVERGISYRVQVKSGLLLLQLFELVLVVLLTGQERERLLKHLLQGFLVIGRQFAVGNLVQTLLHSFAGGWRSVAGKGRDA